MLDDYVQRVVEREGNQAIGHGGRDLRMKKGIGWIQDCAHMKERKGWPIKGKSQLFKVGAVPGRGLWGRR